MFIVLSCRMLRRVVMISRRRAALSEYAESMVVLFTSEIDTDFRTVLLRVCHTRTPQQENQYRDREAGLLHNLPMCPPSSRKTFIPLSCRSVELYATS